MWATAASYAILPLILIFMPSFVVEPPNEGMCRIRALGRAIAEALPDKSFLGAVYPKDNGLIGFMLDLDLAFEEETTGRAMRLAWRSDSFHSFISPTVEDTERKLKEHPETTALVYAQNGYGHLKEMGIRDDYHTGFQIWDGRTWQSLMLYLKMPARKANEER